MIARAHIVNSKSNLKTTQQAFDRVYSENPCDTFKIDKALVYQILSKFFTDMDTYIYVKQKESTQDG